MGNQKQLSFFYKIYTFFFKLWIQVLSLFKNKSIQKTETTLVEQNNLFVDKNKTQFKRSIENLDSTKNQNIDHFFYNKKEYRQVMEEPHNRSEKTWKSRILMQSTPQGTNIIMYYDPYKLGFTYYCDQNMSYNILNSIAMKYVLLYKCYDFFLDEYITPEPSSIIKLLEDDKPDTSKNNSEKDKGESKEDKEWKDMLKRAPVAKFKNYNKASGKVENKKKENNENEKSKEEKREPEKPKERNRFIYLGKVTNFSFLQKTAKKPTIHFSDSSLIKSGLFANSEVQKEVFNYRDFKRLKETTVVS